jgi:uncharacterized alpha-E superfamily protein
LLPPILGDPANPFSLIFSIRKIPNDLLDLERATQSRYSGNWQAAVY